MAGRQITVRALDALQCIRSGMSDAELMEKFSLSASALQSLFSQLVSAGILQEDEIRARTNVESPSVVLAGEPERPGAGWGTKPIVDAAEALRLLKAGMDDATIMARFDISAKGLQSLFRKLVAMGVLLESELIERAARDRSAMMGDGVTAEPEVADLDKMGLDSDTVTQAIKSGADDLALMERFSLSAEALQAVFESLLSEGQLGPEHFEDRSFVTQPSVMVEVKPATLTEPVTKKPIIDAADALHRIRDGLDDAALMKRFEVSARGLQSLFSKLVAAGALTQKELDERAARIHSSVIVDEELPDLQPPHAVEAEHDLGKMVDEIKAGAAHETLMDKYDLSSKALQGLLSRMVAQGVIAEAELDRPAPHAASKFEIRHRTTGKTIFSGNEACLGALVQKAIAERVDLSESDLNGANLSRRDLSGARLANADLRKAILVGTDLTAADLSGAALNSADLYAAILYKTNLAEANLSDANLTGVNAVWAFLPKANLSEANLTNANLTGANLAGANLFESILTGAKLDGAYLQDTKMENIRNEPRKAQVKR